jgi:hypothetical protein
MAYNENVSSNVMYYYSDDDTVTAVLMMMMICVDYSVFSVSKCSEMSTNNVAINTYSGWLANAMKVAG